MATNVTRLRPSKPCPICGKPSVQQFHPFCSARCADVDLNRWLTGSYVIPGGRSDGETDEGGQTGGEDDE
ncbi:MAG TPA: DNA gyrase inhibitor YacG [Pelagibacterium sp.]|uniref:DNA gyrase inhibitor YacG n=1 Tax=Pelagibacterium sp. TaxID=1967288 RepID=UPI002B6B821E|nr:DNA gyrase inhibitor YacG [Pelagibacterium sp.]HWJ89043.1 DNA gyrase inhibitor YacG [Pelagibacterium sp.]